MFMRAVGRSIIDRNMYTVFLVFCLFDDTFICYAKQQHHRTLLWNTYRILHALEIILVNLNTRFCVTFYERSHSLEIDVWKSWQVA